MVSLPMYSENEEGRKMNPHQLRIGWGDQHFEHLAWHETSQPKNILPETYVATYAENFRYTQHWFAEYQYRWNSWFSFGGAIDGSGVQWDNVTRNGLGNELSRVRNQSLFNLVVMPKIYFTYLHHDYVSLYSGLGVGFDINGGTEKDMKGRTTICAPALDLTLIGVSANYRNWFIAVDLGGLFAYSEQTFYLLGSRLFSASIGVTF